MKNYIQKHKFIFTTIFVVIAFVTILSFTYNTISKSKINIGSTSDIHKPVNVDYENSTEEKEAPQFNIFSLLNKFIPN